MIDHDRLFKELLSTFFVEFLALFLPEMMQYLEPESVTFLDKEVFTDVTAGSRYETDLLAQVQFQGQPSFFLIHVENQATAQAEFGKRMFRYFARLYEKYDYPVYPIVVFSYDQPRAPAPSEFTVAFPDFAVLSFSYRVIQLNQLHWRDFLSQPNPVATALMAKMQIAPAERPRVKAECLRLLVTLRLDPARMQLISGFVDTYLKLTPEEETAFTLEVGQIEPAAQEQVMEIVTSWMERGIEQGLERGRREGELRLLLRLLSRIVGTPSPAVEARIRGLTEAQIEQLTDRLPTLSSLDELAGWLDELEAS
ncbi:DUF4351 domain-containing protein [Romeria aff. gracilis LEGE 07310]|uniref:DUF4351 domain-containing protein n=1 Tax=Vasconcelosia minhoensis LEGE 07310 TaxID=915328 RepID=A0A8J7AQE5_9CYAN|nr:DUF4351 domain-containing protein [Romeria aff. gracilis LEGE 07310]